MAVQLENQGNLAGEFSCACLKKPQWSRVGIATCIDRQLKMIGGIVPPCVGGKAPSRTMLEPLVHRKDNQLPSPCQLSVAQQTGDIGSSSHIVAAVPTQNFLYPISHISLR